MKSQEFNGEIFRQRVLEAAGGISQKEFAATMGFNPSSVSKWFSDKETHVTPPLETVIKIAKKYNCSVDYLLGLDMNKAPEDITEKMTDKDYCRVLTKFTEIFNQCEMREGDELITLKIPSRYHICSPADAKEQAIYEFFSSYLKIKQANLDEPTIIFVTESLLEKIESRYRELCCDIVPNEYIHCDLDDPVLERIDELPF